MTKTTASDSEKIRLYKAKSQLDQIHKLQQINANIQKN